MKALTIGQPYASLIADGEKWVENRTWKTNYRGPIAIHAGKGTQYLSHAKCAEQGLPIGAIVATAELVACVEWDKAKSNRDRGDLPPNIGLSTLLNHEHTEGPWLWVLDRVWKLAVPILETGKQGIWATKLVSRPKRIQRKRSRGWRLPTGATCVTRPGSFGNPFETAQEFRQSLMYFMANPASEGIEQNTEEQNMRMRWIAENLDRLRGFHLACFCETHAACHADVLIRYANGL
jgi:hypothetical protein